MGGSSGQTPVTQQTVQTKDPWSAAQPHLTGIMGQAATMYGAGTGYQPYTGNTTANPFNQYSNQAVSDITGIANAEPYGSAALQGARDYMSTLVGNQGLSDPLKNIASTLSTQQNPYLQGVINQQMDKVNSAMSGAGRYGSGAHDAGIAQAISGTLAQDYLQRQGMATDIYNQGLQRAGQASQLIPSLDQARFGNANAMLGLGSMQQGYDQALLDQQLKLWNAQQAYPWEQLSRYAALAQGAGGLGGQQVTTSPGATQPSQLQRILGGATAGAGIGTAIFPGIGTGVGALGGGLLGMM
jgi:hypothetical protein